MNQPPPRPSPPQIAMYELLLMAQGKPNLEAFLVRSVLDVICHFLNSCKPRVPAYTAAVLSANFSSSDGGGEDDRLSALPDTILRDVISRLPAKEAARTAKLSKRWRTLWRSAPLVLLDGHLRPDTDDYDRLSPEAKSGFMANAVTRVLEAHPGPFRYVALSLVGMYHQPAVLARWMLLLATKGVEELVLMNRPRPLDYPLPSAIFSLASVRRLHLGIWRFPDTTALPRGAAFPHLVELGLGYVAMEDEDLDFILARSPALESLVLYSSQKQVNLRIISSSLWCVQLCLCLVHGLAVVNAPCLERLFLWEALDLGDRSKGRTKVKFGDAPNLRIVGFLFPGIDVLEVGDTVIKVGTKASSSTIVPSVRILALNLNFKVRDETEMLPSFLRCFPNVEILHIESVESIKSNDKFKKRFWKENSCIECVQSHIRKMVFFGYQGGRNELAFLKFILKKAQVLQEIVIIFASGSRQGVGIDLAGFLSSVKKASENCRVVVSNRCRSREFASWSCVVASDVSVADPFANFFEHSMAS